MFVYIKNLYGRLRNIYLSLKVNDYINDNNHEDALTVINKMNMNLNPVTSYAKRATIKLALGNNKEALNDYNKSLDNLENKLGIPVDTKNYFRSFIYFNKAVVYNNLNEQDKKKEMILEYYRYNIFDIKNVKKYIQKEFTIDNYMFHRIG